MSPEQIVRGVEQLCSLPDVVVRANELIDSPNAGAAEIGEVIGHDPGLSAQLLKLVNSAFYSFPATIDSVPRAISVIGTQELRSLILSASATQVFNRIAPDVIDMDDFWHRSVYVGLMAGKLARHLGVGKGETPFLIGLLHDIGKIVLFSQLPEEMGAVLAEAQQSSRPLYEVERERDVPLRAKRGDIRHLDVLHVVPGGCHAREGQQAQARQGCDLLAPLHEAGERETEA